MKTTNISQKTISTVLIVLLVSSQHVFAQNQSTEIQNNSLSHNLTFMLAALFFIVGFATLIILKVRDDSKQQNQSGRPNQAINMRHRSHYGSKHQYHH